MLLALCLPPRALCFQTEQDGTVAICGPDEASVQAAAAKIRGLVSEVEVGVVYRFAWLALTCWHAMSGSSGSCQHTHATHALL